MNKLIYGKGTRRALCLIIAALMALSLSLPALAQKPEEEASPFKEKTSEGYDPERAPSVDADMSVIRVLISTGSTSYVDIDLCTCYILNEGPRIGGSVEEPLSLRVKVSGSSVKLTVKSSGEELYSGPEIALSRITERYEAGYLTLKYSANSKTKGLSYLGSFRFMANSGNVAMINDISMAYYLYGIIGYELSTNSYPEALKAQAIAAKAMGICYMGGTASYDVKDGWTSSIYQGYHGFDIGKIVTMPYCLEVIGEAMIYNNTFVPAYYGHSNGGETGLPSHAGYGSSQDEQYAVMLDDYEFEYPDSSRMILHVDYGEAGTGPIFDFILCELQAVYGIDARRVVSVEQILLYDPLPGTERNMRKLRIKATVEYSEEDPDLTEPTKAFSDHGLDTGSFTIECPPSELHTLQLTDVDGSGDDYSENLYVFYKNLKMYWGYREGGGYTLVHGRKGHGIGFSQIGALARANPDTLAQNYREILAFYYPLYRVINVTERAPGEGEDPLPPLEPVLAYGTFTVNNAEIRMGGSTAYPISAYSAIGEHVDILGINSAYMLKIVWRGMTGYTHAGNVFVDRFPSPANGVFLLMDGVNPSSANLRSQPYGSASVIIKLPKNTAMTCWAQIGKWCYVHTSTGLWGFISSAVVNFGDPYEYTGAASLNVARYFKAAGKVSSGTGSSLAP